MILITGASGFVGRHLVAALTRRPLGQGLRLLDMRPFDGPRSDGMEVLQGSIENTADVQAAMAGVDTVIHLAAFVQPTSRDEEQMFRVNVLGTQQLFLAAVAAGCRHFVHVSSAGIYGPPRGTAALKEGDEARPSTAYQRTKWQAEEVLRGTEAKATVLNILRPTGIYGAGSRLELPRYRRLLRRQWALGLEGRMLLNPLHVSDLTSAIIALIARPAEHGTVFNLGGEQPIDSAELDALVASALGVGHRRFVVPPAIAEPAARLLTPALHMLGRPNPLLRTYARGCGLSAVVDDTSFRQQYPDVPMMGLHDGVREHVGWALAEGLI